MSALGRHLLAAVLLCACSRSPEKVVPRNTAVIAPDAAPAKSAKSAQTPHPKPLPAQARGEGTGESAAEAGKEPPKIVEETDLKTEEIEANPYSETVTLKLTVTPQVKALVLWGAKQLAHLEPGKMEAEITRPRGSGPVDLEIKAEGYMPYHTRLHADRNDKLGVRLYRPEEAPSIFGYSRSAEAKKLEAERAEKPK